MPAELLHASGLESGYGRVQVLWGAALSVREGETVVLLGANGAGKTTLLKVLMGLLPAWRGELRFVGDDITHLRTDRRVRARHRLHVGDRLFPGPDGRGKHPHRRPVHGGGARCARAWPNSMASSPRSRERRKALASSLSGGQRKMLGIAKALAGNPRLLIMDEPSAGLSPLFVKEVIRALGGFRGQGLSLPHRRAERKFLELADRVYTLEGGRIGFEGTVEAMHENDALRRAYFGLK